MKIFVQSTDSQARIQIDLIDNPPLARWVSRCIKLQELYPITGKLYFNDTANSLCYPTDNEEQSYIDLLLIVSKLKTLLEEKQITQFVFPDLPNKFNRSQHWCNDIHNVFVDLSIYLEHTYSEYWKFSETWDSRVYQTVKELNITIHKLEAWAIKTENSKYVEYYSHKHLQTQVDIDYHGLDLWFELNEDEQKIYSSTYKNNAFYNVVFSNEILGKTYYKSFIDEEQATSPAISGIDKTWGNLDIKLDQQREAIFKGDRFQAWMNEVDNNKLNAPLEFPVGTISPLSDLDYFVKRKATNVTFHFVY